MSHMNYYIFSYGGCGSTMLTGFLGNFGKAYHLHDRTPPEFLSSEFKVAEKTNCKIWMSDDLATKVDDDKARAIYIYRDPVKAVISRPSWQHTYHIEGDIEEHPEGTVEYASQGVDRRRYEEHFDNWNDYENINYKVLYLNYDHLWENLNTVMGYCRLPRNLSSKFPQKRETKKDIPDETVEILREMYYNLSVKIDDVDNCFVK